MNTKHMLLSVLGIVCATAFTAHAQVYKWVDERGVTQYSDTPPSNGAHSDALDIATTGYAAAPSDRGEACHTIRCQYERLRNDRIEDEKQAQINARSRPSVVTLQAPNAPLTPRQTFRYAPRWPGYGGGIGVWGRWGIAPFGHAPQLQSPPPSSGSSSLAWPN